MDIHPFFNLPESTNSLQWLDIDLLAHYSILLSRSQYTREVAKAAKESVSEALEREYKQVHNSNNVGLVSIYATMYCNCVVMGIIALDEISIDIEPSSFINADKYASDKQFLIDHINVYYEHIKGFIEEWKY